MSNIYVPLVGVWVLLLHERTQICDFGLAKWREFSLTRTSSRTQRGTVTHIPPENWADVNAPRTLKYDVYGFAVMLWQLVTERQPFGAHGQFIIIIRGGFRGEGGEPAPPLPLFGRRTDAANHGHVS